MDDKLKVASEIDFANQKLNFIGKGNIWINDDNSTQVIKTVQDLIYQALANTAPGQLTITVYDATLSGIAAPFSSLASGENKVIEILSTPKDFETRLIFFRQHIAEVQNLIQGTQENLSNFRESLGVAVESYHLFVIALDLDKMDKNLLNQQLSVMMKRGAAAGVSFLIVSPTELEEVKPIKLDRQIQILSPRETAINVLNIVAFCKSYLERLKKAQLPTVTIPEIVNTEKSWTENSTEGITFPIGKYGTEIVNIMIGDEINQRHNMLVTGAVGQGKSNLLSVIVHSIAQRYSPDEVALYLLDFKEGVSLKPYANIDQEEYLPHARLLGLSSDPILGKALLEKLFEEYKTRMQMFKMFNLKSYFEYRKEFPDIALARILVIIDEYQLMFDDDDKSGREIAKLLEKAVRLFRAAGIHFILASQLSSGSMAFNEKKEGIFAQIMIRIAHKNSLTESHQTLGINNSAAAFLKPHEAVVNLDFGEPTQNRKTIIAFADDDILLPLRHNWWEKGKSYPVPYIFDGEKDAMLGNALTTVKKERNPMALVGEKISISGELVQFPMTNELGRNIALIGSVSPEKNIAENMISSMMMSLMFYHKADTAVFHLCDFSPEAKFYEENPNLKKIAEAKGFQIEIISPENFESKQLDLLESQLAESSQTHYVFGLQMDRWKCEIAPYEGSPLTHYFEEASNQKIHFIGWWLKASKFSTQVGNSNDPFNSKIFLKCDERTVQSLTNPFIRYQPIENRALAYDEVELQEPQLFIPFAPLTDTELNKIIGG